MFDPTGILDVMPLAVFPPRPAHMSAREIVALLERDLTEFESIETVARELDHERCVTIPLRRRAHIHGRRYKVVGVARSKS